METLERRAQGVAVLLAGLAGFVDAIGFKELGGFFVSFMSGNTTRFGVGAAGGSPEALIALALMLAFTCGMAAGVLIGRRAGAKRPSLVLALCAGVLVAAGLVAGTAAAAVLAGALLAFAMGAENAVFEREGRVRVGLTYMTGALVGLGQRLADLIDGRRPKGAGFLAGLWAGMAGGATLGALAHGAFGMTALLAAAAMAAVMSALLWRTPLA